MKSWFYRQGLPTFAVHSWSGRILEKVGNPGARGHRNLGKKKGCLPKKSSAFPWLIYGFEQALPRSSMLAALQERRLLAAHHTSQGLPTFVAHSRLRTVLR